MRISIAAAVACLSIIGVTATAQVHAAMRQHTEIPPEPLDLALRTLAKDRGFQVVYLTEDVRALKTPGAVGDLTVDEALKKLLSDSHLEYKFVDENTVSIFPKTDTTSAPEGQNGHSTNVSTSGSPPPDLTPNRLRLAQTNLGQAQGSASIASASDETQVGDGKEADGKAKEEELQEIVVTGTHIRGADPASVALTIYDRATIEATGSVSIGDFSTYMPQNSPSVSYLGGFFGFPNSGGAVANEQGFDLHGLGPEATLTLLNGHRLAGGGAQGQFVDVSIIPVAAVKQVEVLADGASAIYGSDAVAGVVNVILRDDFTGAESSVNYAAPTRSGGGDGFTGSQLLGTAWTGGHAMAVYQFNHQGGLDANSRDFVPADIGGQTLLAPMAKNQSALINAQQSLGDSTELSADAIYGAHDYNSASYVFEPETLTAHTHVIGADVALDQKLGHGWQGTLDGNYSKSDQETNYVQNGTPGIPSNYNLSTGTVHIDASGPLLALPGGSVKTALGTEFRRETYDDTDYAALLNIRPSYARNIWSAFGEAAVPIVGSENRLAAIDRLELSLAGRYDHYSDFGHSLNPHIGLLWIPLKGLNLRGSYAQSYRAPRLDQLIGPIPTNFTTYVPNPVSPTGQTDLLIESPTGNPHLGAETSRTYTAGFDLKPLDLDGFHLSATYFNTVFSNRIGNPPCPNYPNCFFEAYNTSYLNSHPNLAEVEQIFSGPGFVGDEAGAGPQGVQAIFNLGLTNLQQTSQSGVDLSASYAVRLPVGAITLAESATYLIDDKVTPAPGAPAAELLNQFGEPLKLRARSSLGWSVGGFSSLVTADYRNAYNNGTTAPPQPIASWTTVDMNFSYRFSDTNADWLTRGIRIALTVTNVFDRNPPYVQLPSYEAIGFDPANANPLGRVIAVSLDKKW